MDVEDLGSPTVIQAIERCGYKRVGKNRFKAVWASRDVDHYLFLRLGRSIARGPPNVLGIEYGMFNPDVFAFSGNALCTFGGKLYQHDNPSKYTLDNGYMAFTLLEDHGHWGLSVYLPDADLLHTSKILESKIREEIVRPCEDITSFSRYYSVLVSDSAAFRWSQVHGALRAAQAVMAGRKAGIADDQILLQLTPYSKFIASGLSRELTSAPLEFVKRCLDFEFAN
ncbi:MAG: hypothetical protein R3D51_17690 [Hyphomicrobiaceae bacterium]